MGVCERSGPGLHPQSQRTARRLVRRNLWPLVDAFLADRTDWRTGPQPMVPYSSSRITSFTWSDVCVPAKGRSPVGTLPAGRIHILTSAEQRAKERDFLCGGGSTSPGASISLSSSRVRPERAHWALESVWRVNKNPKLPTPVFAFGWRLDTLCLMANAGLEWDTCAKRSHTGSNKTDHRWRASESL